MKQSIKILKTIIIAILLVTLVFIVGYLTSLDPILFLVFGGIGLIVYLSRKWSK